jgi:hypothetical protein
MAISGGDDAKMRMLCPDVGPRKLRLLARALSDGA